MNFSQRSVYISNSVNSKSNCMSWGTWLACGMFHSVVLIDQTHDRSRIVQQLDGHGEIVTCLSWVTDSVLVSADNTSEIIVWKVDGHQQGQPLSWRCRSLSLSSSSTITSIHGVQVDRGRFLIACASESTVHMVMVTWCHDSDNEGEIDQVTELDRVSFGPNFVLSVNLLVLTPKSDAGAERTTGTLAGAGTRGTVEVVLSSGLDDGRVMCNSFDLAQKGVRPSTTVSLVGHDDWITSLDSVAFGGDGAIGFLCSSSQDGFSRVWSIKIDEDGEKERATEEGTDKINPLEVHKMVLGNGRSVSIYLDGVLSGHENWVTRSRFRRCGSGSRCRNGKAGEDIVLMTTSMDKSVIIWKRCPLEPIKNKSNGKRGDDEDWDIVGQWCETTRLGQVGGNTLGLIGGDMSPDASLIVGFGYQGDMVAWGRSSGDKKTMINEEQNENGKDDEEEEYVWKTVVNLGGHFDSVEDLAWERERGLYLVTVSKDQTTRIHAPWRRSVGQENDKRTVEEEEKELEEWHEVGRPQIHGFDMTSVASISGTTFITGSEEKISRVFGMNKDFARYMENISRRSNLFSKESLRTETVSSDALGLSNKSVEGGGDIGLESISAEETPKEELVAGRTLWPELTKLYGHVFEVFRISCHPGQCLVATTCKALVPEHADIILWNTVSWTIIQRLAFHKSTVLRVQFNRVGDKMVSVSKDRQWALWQNERGVGEEPNFRLRGQSKKINQHSKIIWDTDWTEDDRCFVTASRDKKLVLWSADNCEMIGKPLVFDESVNAVATLELRSDSGYVFAVGLQSGMIKIVQFDRKTEEWSVRLSFKAHHDWISRLQFSPKQDHERDGKFLLASCAKDRFVKIFQVSLTE